VERETSKAWFSNVGKIPVDEVFSSQAFPTYENTTTTIPSNITEIRHASAK